MKDINEVKQILDTHFGMESTLERHAEDEERPEDRAYQLVYHSPTEQPIARLRIVKNSSNEGNFYQSGGSSPNMKELLQ